MRTIVFITPDNWISRWLTFWYIQVAGGIWDGWKHWLIETNYQMAPLLMIRSFFSPLFGDFTWKGLAVGILFRTVRIIVGLMVLTVVFVGGFLTWLAWLILPWIAIYYLTINLYSLFTA